MYKIIKPFSTPARQNDFPGDPGKQAQLEALWHESVNGWTRKALIGNPWSVANDDDRRFYFNESETAAPGSAIADVGWGAFPARIKEYFKGLSPVQLREFADRGEVEGVNICPIPHPQKICGRDVNAPDIPYAPYGPRGFQDEYCEWSVTRNPEGKITRVDFTCENPEYWYTMWRIDPQRVLDLYRATLNKPQIRLEDLYLTHRGQPVIDPATGRPCYDPLNRWNRGSSSTASGGGAMHLTATPNNLDAQVELGAAATMHRPESVRGDIEKLLCCSDYGQPRRNSDPSIGFAANQLMRKQQRIAISDPVGLYIQTPNFDAFRLPPQGRGRDVRECWRVARGTKELEGFGPARNFILHAVFEVPASWGFVVGDILTGRDPIMWGSQIAEHFRVALFVRHFATSEPLRELPCRKGRTNALPEPLQMMPLSLWAAYHGTPVPNPRGVPMALSSNTTTSAAQMKRGTTLRMAFTCDGAKVAGDSTLPTVDFVRPGSSTPDPSVKVRALRLSEVNYTVPGFTLPGDVQMIELELTVAADAAPGVRDIRVHNAGQRPGPARPHFLVVTA